MAETRVERRLAAILAADVVGYSRLMNIDEVSTLEALKAHRRELVTRRLPLIMAVSSRPQAMAHWSNLPASWMRSGALS